MPEKTSPKEKIDFPIPKEISEEGFAWHSSFSADSSEDDGLIWFRPGVVEKKGRSKLSPKRRMKKAGAREVNTLDRFLERRGRSDVDETFLASVAHSLSAEDSEDSTDFAAYESVLDATESVPDATESGDPSGVTAFTGDGALRLRVPADSVTLKHVHQELAKSYTNVSEVLFGSDDPPEDVLWKEDFDSDRYEYYTVQCPKDMDVKLLEKQRIGLSGESYLKLSGRDVKYEVVAQRETSGRKLDVVVPSRGERGFKMMALPLSGSVIILDDSPGIALDEYSEKEESSSCAETVFKKPEKVPMPDFINEKHPFLSLGNVEDWRKTEHGCTLEEITSQSQDETFKDSENVGVTKKKTKKKKHKILEERGDENVGTSSIINKESETTGEVRKKKKSKKKSLESEDLTEGSGGCVPQSSCYTESEANEETVCPDRKKKSKKGSKNRTLELEPDRGFVESDIGRNEETWVEQESEEIGESHRKKKKRKKNESVEGKHKDASDSFLDESLAGFKSASRERDDTLSVTGVTGLLDDSISSRTPSSSTDGGRKHKKKRKRQLSEEI